MEQIPASTGTRRFGRSVAVFAACGLVLYALLFYAAEQLMRSNGRSNPFFKIATLEQPAVDWLVLGTSHAMPLDFDGFNAVVERDTGLRVLNLAAQGTGPLYNRFVLEHFLRDHRARNVLFVADSFAFYSRAWNEDRFADSKLLARTPRDPALAALMWRYVVREDVDPRALLDYATGFSKINNRDRFSVDRWEGEAQFDRVWRSSATAVKKRVGYLYPDGSGAPALERYMGELSVLLDAARQSGARVVVVKFPSPDIFRGQLPAESQFDAALARACAQAGVPLQDFSAVLREPRHYFDSDHLNRTGLAEFFHSHLKAVLQGGSPAPPA